MPPPGADGSGEAAVKRWRDRAERARNHTPMLRAFADWINKVTLDDFDESREFDDVFAGFPPLAQSTIDKRLREHGGFARKSRKDGLAGNFTKKALKVQASFLSVGGIKPLIDTGLTRNSARAVVDSETSIEWSARGTLLPHMTGSYSPEGRPPRRNPTVFEVTRDGERTLKPEAAKKLAAMLDAWISDGKVLR